MYVLWSILCSSSSGSRLRSGRPVLPPARGTVSSCTSSSASSSSPLPCSLRTWVDDRTLSPA